MPLTDDGQVRRIPLLEDGAAHGVIDRLMAARDRWTRRGPGFFTLGAAVYLDVSRGGDYASYQRHFGRSNPVIRHYFAMLAERVRDRLGVLIGESCTFGEGLALPGFHIFLQEGLQSTLRDNLHLDLQHTHLPMGFRAEAPSLTFTLPLEMPDAGGGLETCDIVAGNPRGRLVAHDYRIGELFVHSGRALHRRLHRPATAGCRRITLQGHAIRADRGWQIYW
jgi:hypothetical protein